MGIARNVPFFRFPMQISMRHFFPAVRAGSNLITAAILSRSLPLKVSVSPFAGLSAKGGADTFNGNIARCK